MEIPLVDNWQELYKARQPRVYPVGVRGEQVIDEAFDKLHAQGIMEWTTTLPHLPLPHPSPFHVSWYGKTLSMAVVPKDVL